MKKKLSYKTLFIIGIIAEILRFSIGGLIGSAFAIIGAICIIFAIIGFIGSFRKKKKIVEPIENNKPKEND